MIRNRSLLTAALAFLFAGGAALAQNQNCPRTNCPNPGQNCQRQGQGMRRGQNAQRGPAAQNQGMRGRRMMKGGCGAAVQGTPEQAPAKK